MTSAFTKKARAYGRRKYNSRRRSKNTEKKKQTANRFQNVLGITAAMGYNKNMLSTASELSKKAQTNYLINTLRKKRFEEKKKQFFKNQTGSRLEHAISKASPFAVKMVLKEPGTNIEGKTNSSYGIPPKTPLELAFWHLGISTLGKKGGKRADDLLEIIHILLQAGAVVTVESMKSLWNLDGDLTYRLLEQNPALKENTFEYASELQMGFHKQLDSIKKEIQSEKNGYGYENYNSNYLTKEYDEVEEKLYFLKDFLRGENENENNF